ncbi:MAG: hypothetical protein LBI03_10870 [Clostridiales bacterium]|jgi:tRNA G10  N-methylase Trm11|nr:hypothetical protein [Clostridiales bacterium]
MSTPEIRTTFFVISTFSENNLSFEKMADMVSKMHFRPLCRDVSFRVRFSKENQFAKVAKKAVALAEESIVKNCGLKIDRLNPDTEFWFIIRRENIGFFGQLLKKRVATEKNLHKGELRPELAYLLCCCGNFTSHSVICDPFAGYGSIPRQIQLHFKFAKMYVNDLNKECVDYLNSFGENPNIIVSCADALHMAHIPPKSVDLIISDPPWGFYDRVGDITEFYCLALCEFKRIMKDNGSIVLLSGAPSELLNAAEKAFITPSYFNVLVNGKKAGVFIFHIG